MRIVLPEFGWRGQALIIAEEDGNALRRSLWSEVDSVAERKAVEVLSRREQDICALCARGLRVDVNSVVESEEFTAGRRNNQVSVTVMAGV